jgi:phenylalanyl-tRNA synthetase beta chain
MKLSLAWLRDYVDLPDGITVDRVMHDLTVATVEVEGAHSPGTGLAGVVVGRVESVAPLPRSTVPFEPPPGVNVGVEAPAMFAVVCTVGAGKVVTATSNAINLVQGMFVPVTLRDLANRDRHTEDAGGLVAPRGPADEAFVGTARHFGLEDLFPARDEGAVPDLRALPCSPGDPLADVIGWNDTVLEIDNKSLTNRPDLWSHYGIARELSAIYRCPLKPIPGAVGPWPSALLTGSIEGDKCNRLALLRLVDVRTEPAPFWMRSRLARIGQRPINIWVDLTNYVMFAVGQPCHAYDSAHLALPLIVHAAPQGSDIDLLDGGRYRLDAADLVISDKDGVVDLAGVMGGRDSAVSAGTTEILFEAGSFDGLSVRRTAARLGLRTEASARFEKMLDTDRVDDALALFTDLVRQIQPAAQVAGFHDVQRSRTERRRVSSTVGFFQKRIGTALTPDEIAEPLRALGFDVSVDEHTVDAVAPVWRSTGDITMAHDLLEEVARLRGYDNFEFVPPTVQLEQATLGPRLVLARRTKEVLAFAGGLQEVLTYPWTRDGFLEAMGMMAGRRVRLAVPPKPDQASLRPSLLPNLLEVVARNVSFSPQFRIFEYGRVFLPDMVGGDSDNELLPSHPQYVAAAYVGAEADVLFSQAKGLLELLPRAAHMGPLEFSSHVTAPWADVSGRLSIVSAGAPIGTLGVLSKRARRLAGIKRSEIVMFELNVDALEPLASRENRYRSVSEHPESDYDLSLLFRDEVAWRSIEDIARAGHPLVRGVRFVDQYRGRGVPPGQKSVTLRVRIGAENRTLTTKEINEAANGVVEGLKKNLGGELRS